MSSMPGRPLYLFALDEHGGWHLAMCTAVHGLALLRKLNRNRVALGFLYGKSHLTDRARCRLGAGNGSAYKRRRDEQSNCDL